MAEKSLLEPITTSTQPTYFVTGQAVQQTQPLNGPPLGRWRDGICDCLTNLWPSCGCAIWPYGIWIMSQSKFLISFYTE